MNALRCDYSDLLVIACGCVHCRPDVPTTPAGTFAEPHVPAGPPSRSFPAKYAGRCRGCGERFDSGTPIAMVGGKATCLDCVEEAA